MTKWSFAEVTDVTDVAVDVRQITLRPSVRSGNYAPGAHIEVAVDVGSERLIRHYSLVGRPLARGDWRIAVKLRDQSRGGSRHMHKLKVGDRIEVSSPSSHFNLRYGRPAYLLIAGGIGVTPLIGMAEALTGAEASVRFVYAGPSADRMAFVTELEILLGRGLATIFTDTGQTLDLSAEIATLHPDGELYICGPAGLMQAARSVWNEQGRPADRFRMETFGTGDETADVFDVFVRDHDRHIRVEAERSLLDALADAGVEVASDCRRGECGLCAVSVIEMSGDLDHRDVFLSPHQKQASDTLCCCVSRAKGTIVIDTGYRSALT